jgi:anhydro-N-acetylmuramic acid kinase
MSGQWTQWVGVMSGTSLDGVDAVLARFRGEADDFEWELLGHHAEPFGAEFRRRLLALAGGEKVTAAEISRLHFGLGEFYAETIQNLLTAEKRAVGDLAGIGLSGQTVYHQGARQSLGRGVTYQIGSAAIVAERVRGRVVSDFRSADVAAGGEGAPLVPFADYLLFRDSQEGRIVLNLGGIANLTAIPAGGAPDEVIAFDTGPGNMVMDGIVQELSDGSVQYDENGARAAGGKVNPELLEDALTNRFFAELPPRSTGREQFGDAYVQRWIQAGRAKGLSDDDLVATACALTAESVAKAIQDFVTGRMRVDAVYVAGGGAKNSALMKELTGRLPGVRVESSRALGLAPECREALAFAVLAHETVAGRPGNLPQVTGAARRVILGQVSGGSR